MKKPAPTSPTRKARFSITALSPDGADRDKIRKVAGSVDYMPTIPLPQLAKEILLGVAPDANWPADTYRLSMRISIRRPRAEQPKVVPPSASKSSTSGGTR